MYYILLLSLVLGLALYNYEIYSLTESWDNESLGCDTECVVITAVSTHTYPILLLMSLEKKRKDWSSWSVSVTFLGMPLFDRWNNNV